MEKITIKSKDITIEFDYNKLCSIILGWSLEERINLIHYILNHSRGNEKPLKELAQLEYDCSIRNAKQFDEMSRDKILDCPTYKDVSDRYQKDADCWKTFLDI